MITEERFCHNINLAHLACISGNDDMYLNILRGLLVYFPNSESELSHFCIFTNFGMLEGHEITPEEFFNELLENETITKKRENI